MTTFQQHTTVINNTFEVNKLRKVLKSITTGLHIVVWLSCLVLAFKFGFFIKRTTTATAQVTNVQSVKRPQVLASFDTISNKNSDLPSADTIFDKVNEVRKINGLRPLEKNSVLAKLAQDRADDMVVRNYYAHENPDGKLFYNLLEDQGYNTGFACENLDLSFINSENQYVSDWFNSTHGHRECMLDSSITDAGYAVSSFDTGNGSKEYLVVAIHAEIK